MSFEKHRFTRNVVLGCLLAGGLCLSACSKKEKPEEKAKTAQAAEPKKAPKKPKKPVVDQELVNLAKSVQTQEDFEEAAEKEITSENLEAEADKMEQELAAAGE